MNEAELLFTDILDCDRLSLYVNKDLSLDKISSSLVSAALKRRIRGEPIQYILGKAEFMGLKFQVTPDVLIPRPETEILVETVLNQLSVVSCQLSDGEILDIGTGSGCIAISLAKFLKNIKVTATDISYAALKVAKANAIANNVNDKIIFIHSDLFTSYELWDMSYDIIVSNPPYISTAQIDTLQPEIRCEPRLALDGGKEGLDFYRRIIHDVPRYLKKGGFLIMEAGLEQKDAIKNIFQKSGVFKIIEWIKDYNNIDRVVVAKKER